MIALIAHDKKKAPLIEFVERHIEFFRKIVDFLVDGAR